jgi:hypothetical protein
MADEESRALQTSDSTSGENVPAEASIKLKSIEALDLSGLSTSEIAELKQQHASGMIDIQKKAEELKVDVAALDATLGSFTDQVGKATQAETSATITHTQTSTVGRTEVVIGNTDRAATGKVSRSARGEQDKTLWIIGIVAVVAIALAVIFVVGK